MTADENTNIKPASKAGKNHFAVVMLVIISVPLARAILTRTPTKTPSSIETFRLINRYILKSQSKYQKTPHEEEFVEASKVLAFTVTDFKVSHDSLSLVVILIVVKTT